MKKILGAIAIILVAGMGQMVMGSQYIPCRLKPSTNLKELLTSYSTILVSTKSLNTGKKPVGIQNYEDSVKFLNAQQGIQLSQEEQTLLDQSLCIAARCTHRQMAQALLTVGANPSQGFTTTELADLGVKIYAPTNNTKVTARMIAQTVYKAERDHLPIAIAQTDDDPTYVMLKKILKKNVKTQNGDSHEAKDDAKAEKKSN